MNPNWPFLFASLTVAATTGYVIGASRVTARHEHLVSYVVGEVGRLGTAVRALYTSVGVEWPQEDRQDPPRRSWWHRATQRVRRRPQELVVVPVPLDVEVPEPLMGGLASNPQTVPDDRPRTPLPPAPGHVVRSQPIDGRLDLGEHVQGRGGVTLVGLPDSGADDDGVGVGTGGAGPLGVGQHGQSLSGSPDRRQQEPATQPIPRIPPDQPATEPSHEVITPQAVIGDEWERKSRRMLDEFEARMRELR